MNRTEKNLLLRYMKYIEDNNITDISERDEHLLYLFSYVLSMTRRDYRYNQTYLADFVPRFKNILKKINDQRMKILDVYSHIDVSMVGSDVEIDIIYNNLYEIRVTTLKEFKVYEKGSFSFIDTKTDKYILIAKNITKECVLEYAFEINREDPNYVRNVTNEFQHKISIVKGA